MIHLTSHVWAAKVVNMWQNRNNYVYSSVVWYIDINIIELHCSVFDWEHGQGNDFAPVAIVDIIWYLRFWKDDIVILTWPPEFNYRFPTKKDIQQKNPSHIPPPQVSFGMSVFWGSMKSTVLWRHRNRTEILFVCFFHNFAPIAPLGHMILF